MVIRITAGLEGFVCYMDYIYSTTKEPHDTRENTVLEQAKTAGVTLNVSKCKFLGKKKQMKLLGYIMSANSMRADPNKTSAVQDNKHK